MNRILKLALIGISILLAGLALASPPVALADSAQVVSRDYPWSSDHLTLDVSTDVHYHPGPVWHLTLRAPERTLDQLVVQNGRIRARAHGCLSFIPFCIGYGTGVEDTVQVDITGPALRAITIDGSSRITLNGVHQDRLSLQINGSGKVSGDGGVGDLKVDINGSGKVQLARLAETNAAVSIAGNGTVDIAPTNNVSVSIAGSGNVRLHSRPQHVTSHVAGSGGVTEVPANQPVATAPGQ